MKGCGTNVHFDFQQIAFFFRGNLLLFLSRTKKAACWLWLLGPTAGHCGSRSAATAAETLYTERAHASDKN